LGSTKVLSEQSCGTKGFGSSDRAYWIQQIGQNRPELELKINRKKFKGLIDIGADFSVISLTHWPVAWLPNNFSFLQQAQLSHTVHHQNADALIKQLHMFRKQAHQIVSTCTSCL
jgi:hypothetical protein